MSVNQLSGCQVLLLMPPRLPQLYRRVVESALVEVELEDIILMSVRLRRCQVMFLEHDSAQVALLSEWSWDQGRRVRLAIKALSRVGLLVIKRPLTSEFLDELDEHSTGLVGLVYKSDFSGTLHCNSPQDDSRENDQPLAARDR